VGVAVNVTDVPEHTGFDDAAMETLTAKGPPTSTLKTVGLAGLHPKEFV
jgi:hypothetical protein